MRRFALLCSATVLAACAKTETPPPADTGVAAAPAAPVAPATAPITLGEVAGKYAVTGKNEAGDTTLVTYELNATPDTAGWTITFPKRKPIPMHVVSVAGDSIVGVAGPYPSAIYKGAQTTTNTVMRLQNGKLVSRTVARYTGGPDSMRIVIAEGVKK